MSIVWTIYLYSALYIALYWLFALLSKEVQTQIEESRKTTRDDVIIFIYSVCIIATLLFAPVAVLYQIVTWVVGKIIK